MVERATADMHEILNDVFRDIKCIECDDDHVNKSSTNDEAFKFYVIWKTLTKKCIWVVSLPS